MNKKRSRVQNSIFNLTSGLIYRMLIMITAFIVRTIFIRCLDEVYLGVNGLYSNILSMLSLAEMGFGTAMVYSMYQPLAQNDDKKLRQLMHLYKTVYTAVGTFIFVVGLCLIPILPNLIKDQPDIEGLTFYYVLFLLNTVFSYWFFAYRNSLLQAGQKAYIISNYSSIFNLIKSALQIALLLVFHNFTVYLITQMLCTIGQNIALAIKVQKEYPVFQDSKEEQLPKEEKRKIFRDVKALMLQKVSFTILNSTDNIIISAFIGLKWVGLLSNFNLIIEAITGILCQITNAIQASMGNYFATEDRESGYRLFKRIEFLNFWLYCFGAIALITLLNPFITLWLGKKFVMSRAVVICLGVNFFVAGFMNTMSTFRSTLGLFTQGQYRPLIVAGINVVVSILLGIKFGVAGVLAGTFISRASINLWFTPLVIHRDGFGKSVKPFYFRYLKRVVLMILMTAGMIGLSDLIFVKGVTFLKFVIMVVLTGIIPNALLFVVYHKTEEFKYYVRLITSIGRRSYD